MICLILIGLNKWTLKDVFCDRWSFPWEKRITNERTDRQTRTRIVLFSFVKIIKIMAETVSTVVRFKDNRLSSITPLPLTTEINDRSVFQRRIYLVLGVCILISLVLPNIFDIYHAKEDFAYHLLFIFHASSFVVEFLLVLVLMCVRLACLLLFFISTAIFRSKSSRKFLISIELFCFV